MQTLWLWTGLLLGLAPADEGVQTQEIKFAACPPAVRKTLQTESKGARIETVTREKDADDEVVFWAEAALGGRTYAIGVLEDGTLTEMNLAVDDEELAFDRCPADVQATFRAEAFGEKVETVGKDIKYGVTIYETVIEHNGKSYEIVVAEDGSLVEKALVIDDEEVEMTMCPSAVRSALHEQARGGKIGEITRSTGIGGPTYEAEIEIRKRIYLIEVAENGALISKSLEAVEE